MGKNLSYECTVIWFGSHIGWNENLKKFPPLNHWTNGCETLCISCINHGDKSLMTDTSSVILDTHGERLTAEISTSHLSLQVSLKSLKASLKWSLKSLRPSLKSSRKSQNLWLESKSSTRVAISGWWCRTVYLSTTYLISQWITLRLC